MWLYCAHNPDLRAGAEPAESRTCGAGSEVAAVGVLPGDPVTREDTPGRRGASILWFFRSPPLRAIREMR